MFNGKLKPEVSKISVIFKQSNNLSIERVFKTMNPLEDVSQPVGDELCFLTVGHIPAPIEETALAPLTQDIHGAENRTLIKHLSSLV